MKKCLLATALALLITGCAQQTFTVQNKPAAVAPKEPSPIISSFLELGKKKKLSMQPNLWRRRKCFCSSRNPANIRKWIAFGFITLGIYALLEARVYCSQ